MFEWLTLLLSRSYWNKRCYISNEYTARLKYQTYSIGRNAIPRCYRICFHESLCHDSMTILVSILANYTNASSRLLSLRLIWHLASVNIYVSHFCWPIRPANPIHNAVEANKVTFSVWCFSDLFSCLVIVFSYWHFVHAHNNSIINSSVTGFFFSVWPKQ